MLDYKIRYFQGRLRRAKESQKKAKRYETKLINRGKIKELMLILETLHEFKRGVMVR